MYMASEYQKQGNLDGAIEYYSLAIQDFISLNDNENLAVCYTNRSKALIDVEKYDQAVKDSTEAIALHKRLNEKNLIALDYVNRALSYMYLNNFKKALEDINNSISIRTEINDRGGLADSHRMQAFINIRKGDFDKANKDIIFAQRMYVSMGERESIARCYELKGIINFSKKDYENSVIEFNKAVEVLKDSKDKLAYANVLKERGDSLVFVEKGKAVDDYNKARQIYDSLKHKKKAEELVELIKRI